MNRFKKTFVTGQFLQPSAALSRDLALKGTRHFVQQES
jgi:hypothetical protein